MLAIPLKVTESELSD